MNTDLLNKLLKIKDRDEFINLLYSQKEDYLHDKSLWTKDMIDHWLSISGLTMEQFEWSFNPTPPIDDFENEN